MKKVTLEREFLVPSANYCIMWNNMKEICPLFSFRKDQLKDKILFKCNFFDKDVVDQVNAHGVKKICETLDNESIIVPILK